MDPDRSAWIWAKPGRTIGCVFGQAKNRTRFEAQDLKLENLDP